MKTNYFIVRVFVNNVLKKVVELQIYINLNALIHTFAVENKTPIAGTCRVEVLAASVAVGEILLCSFQQQNEDLVLLCLNDIKESETKFTAAINKSLAPHRPVAGFGELHG